MNKGRANFFKAQGLRLGRCLYSSMECEQPAIRAHSIQNAKVLDLLQLNGHVIAPKLRVGKDGPNVDLALVGRNQVSTFPGLCAEHDTALFKPIDTREINIADQEQLFLQAYRSVTRELHAVLEGALKIQAAYQMRIEDGLDPKDAPSRAGMEAVGHMMKAWETWKYRGEFFDPVLATSSWDRIAHDTFMIDDQVPVLAVSSVYSVPHAERGDDLVRVILNIVPLSEVRTAVIFSYAEPDAPQARAWLDRVLKSSGPYQMYELSKIIIGRIENFALAPRHFNSWSDEKKRHILDAFISTIGNEEMPGDDQRLMLF